MSIGASDKLSTKTWKLFAIQCKLKKEENPEELSEKKKREKKQNQKKVREAWWESLGVSLRPENSKSTRAAEWSRTGIEEFRKRLVEKTGSTVELERIMVLSSSILKELGEFPLPASDENVTNRVWFREMLEPSFSALNNDASEISDD